MFLNKQKIYLVIILGFFISLIISNNYLNSYDKTSSKNNSHLMIKESIVGDWYRAQEIKEKCAEIEALLRERIDTDDRQQYTSSGR